MCGAQWPLGLVLRLLLLMELRTVVGREEGWTPDWVCEERVEMVREPEGLDNACEMGDLSVWKC